MIINKPTEFIIEWASTFFVIAGATLTSVDIYPLNLAVSMIGNIGWLIIGIIWKRWSLIIIQLVLSFIYIIGLLNHRIH